MNRDTSQLLEENFNEISENNDHEIEDDDTQNSKIFPQYITSLAATIPAFLSGMVLGWTSPIMDSLLSGKYNNLSINTNQMGWIGSFTTLGAMTMCIPTGFICDSIGRKKTLLAISIPFITGWLLILFSKSVLMLYLGRLISGMGFGASCVAVPIYISEISEKKIRGTLGSYFQLMVANGILMSYIAGSFLSTFNFTIFCSILPFFFLIVFIFQPESPVFLVKKGLNDEAEKCLKKLRGNQRLDVSEELNEIEGILKESGHSLSDTLQTFRRYSNLRALLIAFSLMFFQQFCGINAVILYSTNIFDNSGLKNVQICTIVLGLIQVISTFGSSILIDKLGRRILMMVSSGTVGLASSSLAIFFTLKNRVGGDFVENLNLLPVISLGIFILMFAIGLGPIPWVIGAEIFPTEIKSIACSGAGTFNMFLAFLITKFFLDVSQSIGEDSSFYIFSFFSFLGVLFTYFVLPETKGKSIEEIQLELSS